MGRSSGRILSVEVKCVERGEDVFCVYLVSFKAGDSSVGVLLKAYIKVNACVCVHVYIKVQRRLSLTLICRVSFEFMNAITTDCYC